MPKSGHVLTNNFEQRATASKKREAAHYATGISISAGGAHGIAFLGRLKALNDAGKLNNLSALSGSSAGAVIASIVGSTVNRGLLSDGHAKNIQGHLASGIDHTFEIFKKAASNGSDINIFANVVTMGAYSNPFLGPFFASFADVMPDQVNDWHMRNLPPYLNPEAVKDGPIDIFIGVSEFQKGVKLTSITHKNDVRPEIITASCAIKRAVSIDGREYIDGGFTKAAPVTALLEESHCSDVIMIGERHDYPKLARHQTQAMLAEGSDHAVGHFEGHAGRLQRLYPEADIQYEGVPLPDCDKSRRNITLHHFNRLFAIGYNSFDVDKKECEMVQAQG